MRARTRWMIDHGTSAAYRRSVVGQILARGPLDYDVPVTRRCAACGGVFESPLGEFGACPLCSRYPEAA